MKYYHIYKKVKKNGLSKKECFICQEEINNEEYYFDEKEIFVENVEDKAISYPYYYICTKCVKTTKQAEEIMIPLLKIMYGEKIKIIRYNALTKNYKNFIINLLISFLTISYNFLQFSYNSISIF